MRVEKALFYALIAFCIIATVFLAIPKSEDKKVAFFAYGTNLDPAVLRSRAGGFEFSGAASLQGFRLAFQTNRGSEFGVGNIVPDANGTVSGAVYFLTERQAKALDESAGVPNFYEKKSVKVEFAGGMADAFTYSLSGNPVYAAPSSAYLASAQKGMLQFHGSEGIAGIESALDDASARRASDQSR